MITLEEALAASGQGVWRSFTCPVHDDGSPSARVNVLSGKWVCMSCGARGTAANHEPDPDRLLKAALEAVDAMDAVRTYPESWLDQFDAAGPGEYWLSRFSEAACAAHRLGYDTLEQQSVYPFRDDDGTVLGVVRRARPGEHPKYRYPAGVDARAHLFGYPRAHGKDVVVLCEGAPDTVAVTEVEWMLAEETNLSWAAVGCYGKVLHPGQVRLLHRLAPRFLVVGFNADEAGEQGERQALGRLGHDGLISGWTRLPTGRDLADLPRSQRLDTLLQSLATSTLDI